MDLKWPLSKGSQFKFHFYSGWRGNRGSYQSFHITSFSKGCWLIIPKTRHLARIKCMAMLLRLKTIWSDHESKIRMPRDYLVNRLYLQKIKLKWPLSRGNHFKIYFRLEYRGNRGSRQNFHRILFSRDCVLINLSHDKNFEYFLLFLFHATRLK